MNELLEELHSELQELTPLITFLQEQAEKTWEKLLIRAENHMSANDTENETRSKATAQMI